MARPDDGKACREARQKYIRRQSMRLANDNDSLVPGDVLTLARNLLLT